MSGHDELRSPALSGMGRSHVMQYRDCTNPEHQKRFRDAIDRQEEARERYIEALVSR